MGKDKLLEKYLKFTNVDEYHKLGFQGQGVKILLPEKDKKSEHARNVKFTVKAYAPLAYTELITFNPYRADLIADKAINDNFDIVSMSLSNDAKPDTIAYKAIEKAFKRMLDADIIVLLSAGNYRFNGIRSMAKHDKRLIIIGAVEEDLKKASYSSYDTLGTVDLCGLVNVKIYPVYDDKWNVIRTTYFGGTSEACAMVAGLLAVLKSYKNNVDLGHLINKMCVDVGIDGKDNETGNGVLILPSLKHNTIAIEMKKPNGKVVNVHKDYVDTALKNGYSI